MEETKIKNLIEECYINGALNKMEITKMHKAYHKDFAIFYSEGFEMKKLPLTDWVNIVEEYKKSMDSSGLRIFEHEFIQIDITETAAFVKLKLARKGVLVFTDFITLLKFESEWKIVSKIYHTHINDPWKI